MICRLALMFALLVPAIAASAPPEPAAGPPQPVWVENEPTVNVGNEPTVHVGSVVDVDAVITNQSVPVEVLNERLDVRVDPRTRGYMLQVSADFSASSSASAVIEVPFDSYVTGVNFHLGASNVFSAFLNLAYGAGQGPVTPGGANTLQVASANMEFFDPRPGFRRGDSKHVPIPNMFVGEGVELVFSADAYEFSPGSADASGAAAADVYLVPASTGIVPGDIGF